MCSHYESTHDRSKLSHHFGIDLPSDLARHDVWPGYLSTFLRRHPQADVGDEAVPAREGLLGSFGLIPSWSKDIKIARHTYNARSETVAEKPSFRDAWRRAQHCIIPIDAFFEPDWRSGKAVPTRITLTAGADTPAATSGNDTINALTISATGAAATTFSAFDVIDGGAGADSINGDVGADTLTGGAGSDTFVVDATESTEAAMDTITDFTAGPADGTFDTLDISGTSVGANDAAVDVASAEAAGGAGLTITADVVNGVVTLDGADAAEIDTLAEWVNVVEVLAIIGGQAAGADTLAAYAFEFDGDTYVVSTSWDDSADDASTVLGNAGLLSNESVTKLADLVGIVTVSTTEALNTIHIA